MYGTVARMRLKPGMDEIMAQQMRDFEAAKVPGAIAVYVYQMDADPHEYYMAVLWDSKESYRANADSPAQHGRYQAYRHALESEPEWHDGEIVYAIPGALASTAP